MGTIAADMLITHVESKTAVPVQRAYLEAQLVIRGSTAPPSRQRLATPARGARTPAVAGARRDR
jgi:hypothetical protein